MSAFFLLDLLFYVILCPVIPDSIEFIPTTLNNCPFSFRCPRHFFTYWMGSKDVSKFILRMIFGTTLPVFMISVVPLHAQTGLSLSTGYNQRYAEQNKQNANGTSILVFDLLAENSRKILILEDASRAGLNLSMAETRTGGDAIESQQAIEYWSRSLPSSPTSSIGTNLRNTGQLEANDGDKDLKTAGTSYERGQVAKEPNQSIYYRNKLEFSLEGGWLPINVPFPFDFLLGDGYNFPGLYYTLVPVVASLRWQIDDVGGPWILRGNWDATFSGCATVIPRGPETHYFAYMMGIRRNFVPRRWKIAPYWDGQLGMGAIDAKGPFGVAYAQGQNFTFTLNLGSGFRYNLSPKYSIEGGLHYMHISNLYLSQPKFLNYGINVYGPWVGVNVTLGKPRRDRSE